MEALLSVLHELQLVAKEKHIVLHRMRKFKDAIGRFLVQNPDISVANLVASLPAFELKRSTVHDWRTAYIQRGPEWGSTGGCNACSEVLDVGTADDFLFSDEDCDMIEPLPATESKGNHKRRSFSY